LYHWGYSTANESQLVDKVQAKLAWIEGGRVDKRTDEWVMEDPARLVTGHVGRADSGVSVSFWMRQQALISHILGDNQVFHDLLRSWLEPHVVPWTSWKLCYSSTTDGWFMSRFHRQCDYMGPTLTLMRSGENVFGGFIHHSWGGCGSAHGMENEKLIPDERLTASSTFQIEKLDNMHEYRWPRQGRLNNNQGAKKWVPSAMETQEWYQVDLGKENQEITCVAIQPNSNHEQYIKGFEVPYSNDGAAWEILKGYSHVKICPGAFSKNPKYRVREILYPAYGVVRTKYSPQFTYFGISGIQQNITGLSINFRRGKYDVQYSTAKQTWQLLYPVKEGLSHVIITWSEANGLKLFLDGVLKRHSINPVNKTTISSPVNSEAKIEIKTSPRVGPGQLPVALGALKVWPAGLGQEQVKGLYQSAVCDFESGLCIGSVFSPVTNSSWIRTLYCVNTNMPGNCTDGSRTGYFLMLKSSQGLHGQSSMINTTKLVSRYSCFTFQYLMLGSDVGRLNVYQIGYHGNKTFLWMMYGNQSEEWQDARIPLSSVHDFKVTLEGVSGGSYQGFIAIDNVTVTIESCKTHPPIAQPKAGVFSSSMLRHKATLRENITGMLATQGQGSRSWMPCYRLRSNGADLTTFDKLCTGKGPTVTVARTGNALLGGFTEQSWNQAFDYEVFFSYKQGERGFISIPNITISNTFTLSWWMLVQSVQRVYVMTSVGNPGCGASPTKVYLK
ncbi:predicted protein, partial [Nematostella vectensis]